MLVDYCFALRNLFRHYLSRLLCTNCIGRYENLWAYPPPFQQQTRVQCLILSARGKPPLKILAIAIPGFAVTNQDKRQHGLRICRLCRPWH